jgi:hypothetical protein
MALHAPLAAFAPSTPARPEGLGAEMTEMTRENLERGFRARAPS